MSGRNCSFIAVYTSQQNCQVICDNKSFKNRGGLGLAVTMSHFTSRGMQQKLERSMCPQIQLEGLKHGSKR